MINAVKNTMRMALLAVVVSVGSLHAEESWPPSFPTDIKTPGTTLAKMVSSEAVIRKNSSSLTTNRNIPFEVQINASGTTWVHIRNGQLIDDKSMRTSNEPYCTLMVHWDDALIGQFGELVLPAGTVLNFNETRSTLMMGFKEGAFMLCRADSGAMRVPTQSQVKQALGDLMTLRSEN